jgi:serine/threonine-protein kinase
VDADDTIESPAATREAAPLRGLPEGQRRIGDYRLVAELARGGMGTVYLALRRAELVVLKELRHEFLDNAGLVALFEEEGRLAALLSHPNIVQTIDVGREGRRRFIAMEYLEGQPLDRLSQRALMQSKRMPLPTHLRILLEVLAALESAHNATQGQSGLAVVHGEVSPHKVLITYDGQVKLVDFGICETFAAMAEKPADRGVGKVRYMAPEQAAGGLVDGRADLFAVGVMLWEAIADRGPWDDQPQGAVWRSLKAGSVPRVRDAWPYIDPRLAAIVDRSMSARPEQRYATALEMRRDVERHIASRHLRLPSAESLGDFVSRLFAEERETKRAQVQALLHSRTATGLPTPARPVSAPARPAPTPSLVRPLEPDTIAVAPAVGGASLFESALWSELLQPRTAPSSAPPLALPSPARDSSGRRRATLPVAISACLGAFVALAATSATRLHARDEHAPVLPPPVQVASAVTPPIPVIAVEDIPPASNCAVPPTPPSPPPSTAPRSGPKPTALFAHAAPRPPPTSDCAPPYTVDPETGKKQWRLDCL